jgi:hypothetical protein
MIFMRNYIVRREGFAVIVLRKLASTAGRRRQAEVVQVNKIYIN